MMHKKKKVFATIILFMVGAITTFLYVESLVFAADQKVLERGKKVYESRCVICHGPKGDGKGLVGIVHRFEKKGMVWTIYPRDFTTGVFRFRTTPTGCLPTNDDLLRVVTNGIPRAYMPSSADLSLEDRKAVIEYIKTFSPRWKEEEPCKPFPVKKPQWVGNSESVAKGEKLWKDMKCWECHGEQGKGDGQRQTGSRMTGVIRFYPLISQLVQQRWVLPLKMSILLTQQGLMEAVCHLMRTQCQKKIDGISSHSH